MISIFKKFLKKGKCYTKGKIFKSILKEVKKKENQKNSMLVNPPPHLLKVHLEGGE